MEDGVKEETPDKPQCSTVADKAGWIKKSNAGLWGFWKERYMQLCKSQLLMYEDEEEQKCTETVELERYDRCQDLRTPLKKKNRFILIRAPGCKVQDIKFQASTKEEKEAWIKALNDGINRGKNRILDEVKVDESLCLEHVTRGRAKLAQGRRPPTRSHLKEVASATSDGILRLDLDAPDSGPPNSTLLTSEDADAPPSKETPKPLLPPIKPPMPPSEKLSADSSSEDLEVKKPPMLPAKPLKEAAALSDNVNSVEEAAEEDDEDEDGEGDGEEGGGGRGRDGEAMSEGPAEPQLVPVGENLMETDKNAPKPPLPPAKISSEKMKVTRDDPASGLHGLEAEGPPAGSSEAAQEPPAPPPKILSARLRASMHLSKQSSSEAGDCPPEDVKPAENGLLGHGTAQPAFPDGREQEGREPPTELGETKEQGNVPSKDLGPSPAPAESPPGTKPRSASLENLLSAPAKQPLVGPTLQRGTGFSVAQMEKKVTSEQEHTEKLLQKVLQGGLEQAPGSNGPPVNAEALLNEAAAQLRQAAQVLQEVRGLEERKKVPAGQQQGVTKDLVTLYRRSAP